MPRQLPAETTRVERDEALLPGKEQMKAKEMFKRVMMVAELLARSQEQQPGLTGKTPAKTQE